MKVQPADSVSGVCISEREEGVIPRPWLWRETGAGQQQEMVHTDEHRRQRKNGRDERTPPTGCPLVSYR